MLKDDRTQEDVLRVARLNEKYLNLEITKEERDEWLAGIKGALNASDLQRLSCTSTASCNIFSMSFHFWYVLSGCSGTWGVSGRVIPDSLIRDEGLVSQAGDAFSAVNMNDLEQRIYDALEPQNITAESAKYADNAGHAQISRRSDLNFLRFFHAQALRLAIFFLCHSTFGMC